MSEDINLLLTFSKVIGLILDIRQEIEANHFNISYLSSGQGPDDPDSEELFEARMALSVNEESLYKANALLRRLKAL